MPHSFPQFQSKRNDYQNYQDNVLYKDIVLPLKDLQVLDALYLMNEQRYLIPYLDALRNLLHLLQDRQV